MNSLGLYNPLKKIDRGATFCICVAGTSGVVFKWWENGQKTWAWVVKATDRPLITNAFGRVVAAGDGCCGGGGDGVPARNVGVERREDLIA